jgi:hypothetical protein
MAIEKPKRLKTPAETPLAEKAIAPAVAPPSLLCKPELVRVR